MFAIAKAIKEAMKWDALDAVTQSTFKWMNRTTAAERDATARIKKREPAPDSVPVHIRERDFRSDKSKIQRLKVKAWRI